MYNLEIQILKIHHNRQISKVFCHKKLSNLKVFTKTFAFAFKLVPIIPIMSNRQLILEKLAILILQRFSNHIHRQFDETSPLIVGTSVDISEGFLYTGHHGVILGCRNAAFLSNAVEER